MAKRKRTPSKQAKRPRQNRRITQNPALQEAAARTARRLDKELSELGWDQAPAMFALVSTKTILDEPDLEPAVRNQMNAEVEADPYHYTAVLQSLQDNQADIEDLLTHIWWPENVEGVALSLERIILPPSAEAQIPAEPTAQEEYLANHPNRDDIRLVVVVLRDGTSWCTVRARSFDRDEGVAQGANLIPELIEILRESLRA